MTKVEEEGTENYRRGKEGKGEGSEGKNRRREGRKTVNMENVEKQNRKEKEKQIMKGFVPLLRGLDMNLGGNQRTWRVLSSRMLRLEVSFRVCSTYWWDVRWHSSEFG